MTDGPRTFGALLIGAMIAAGFTGILNSQCMSYVKLYPKDRPIFKILVLLIWLLDASHIISVTVALWEYLIDHAGDEKEADYIPKLFLSSFELDPIPVVLDVYGGIKGMDFQYLLGKNFIPFINIICSTRQWSFTLGLALSSILDVLNTGLLCWLLYDSQQDTSSAIAVASMICWLAMPTNLIFMGLHFIISKTYAISLVVTLNRRKRFRFLNGSQPNTPIVLADMPHDLSQHASPELKSGTVAIQVERTTEYSISGA
ncbi:hypothetical protein WG66_001032 [Moniliophthora roreri]|nr:hypothetical protein WG66_001032 [Moniliophthora roreri]